MFPVELASLGILRLAYARLGGGRLGDVRLGDLRGSLRLQRFAGSGRDSRSLLFLPGSRALRFGAARDPCLLLRLRLTGQRYRAAVGWNVCWDVHSARDRRSETSGLFI